MTELTFDEFTELPMQYIYGMVGDAGATRVHVNTEYNIQKTLVTKRKRKGDIYGGWREGKATYCFNKGPDDRWFDTIDQLYVAYMEKACGVQP